MRNVFSILYSPSSWLRRRWIHPRRIVFFIEEKQTENRVFGSHFLSIYARPSNVLTTERLVFSGKITRSRAGKATILLLVQEVDRQNTRPSKVLTTERLVFFRENYEIDSGQGNNTASVPRQNPAVESPHDREACLFSDD